MAVSKYTIFSAADKKENDTDGKIKVTKNEKIIKKSIENAKPWVLILGLAPCFPFQLPKAGIIVKNSILIAENGSISSIESIIPPPPPE